MIQKIIRLVDVSKRKDAKKILYELLKEREPHANISHRRMPTFRQHVGFMRSKPYKSWDLIVSAGLVVGSIYLSKQNEIGLFIFKKDQARGYGQRALKLLMKKHSNVTRFLANINPGNQRSIHFFERLGFNHVQNTYELRKRGKS